MSLNILKVNNITKKYSQNIILSDLSLSISKGSAIAITGESGCGKTTLLSIMGLLQSADTGKVILNDEDISVMNRQKQAALRRRYFGYLFQRTCLLSTLTALENVMLPALLAKPSGNAEKKAKELLTHFGLQQKFNYKPQELSLGQLRRVALARALLPSPAILLADEPTNDLNPQLAKTVGNSLLRARDAGTSVIFVTHDRELAARADQIFELKKGRLYKLESSQAIN